MDKEFTIRVTGGPPPPLPGGKKGKKGGRGGGKNAALAQQQKRYNMRLSGSTPLDQFRKDVFALFNIPSGSTKHYRVSFLGGFPPKELDQGGKATVHDLGVRANESLIVKFTLSDESAAVGNNGSTASSSTRAKQSATSPIKESSPANTNGRKKRAAATAAAASFPELIAAQNAMMKTEQTKKSSKSFGSTNKRIATTSSSPKKGKKVKIEGTGYRLSDGKAVQGAASKRKLSSAKQQPMFKSEDDIAGKLLSSMGGGGGGNTGKFLRMAMKGAVDKSYEESRAAARVSAVNMGEVNFERVKGGTVVEGQGVVLGTAKDHNDDGNDNDDLVLGRAMYMVSYSKGLEGRGRFEEQVEIISQDALKALIEHVYNTRSEDEDDPDGEKSDGKEMLRPVSMAQLSPRVFWSLVYHYNKARQNNDSSTHATVETMLQTTMPHLDWSHLDRGGRKRQLSEKARENLRQATLSTTSTSESAEDGVKAIEEMEESILEAAMPSNNDDDANADNTLSERERRARAAMARFGGKSEEDKKPAPLAEQQNELVTDDWKLVTPSEDDIDELLECINEGKESDSYNEKDAKRWAAALVDNVRNWRGLANVESEVVLAQINDNNLQADTVERWIEVAQQKSIEEIMLEIIDGDQDALDCLQYKAHSSTPKDLSLWDANPQMLLDTLSKDDDGVACIWNETDVRRWTNRAKIALSTLSWLDLYVTPI